MRAIAATKADRRPFRGERLMPDLIVELIVLVLIGFGLLVAPRTGASPLPRPDVLATVDTGAPGRAVPAGFLGLSVEYPSLEQYTGADPARLNPLFLALVRALSPGQALVIRIGGDSTDKTWWPVAGASQPPGVTFTLTPAWMAVARSLAGALDARLILGVNLEADSSLLAGAEARALLSGIGSARVRALELGNEPELYGIFAWYHTAGGQRVTGRPRDWDYASYSSDFAAVSSGLPPAPLAGPAFGSFAWTTYLHTFLASHSAVGLVTLHRYPLQKCFIPRRSQRFPSIQRLLAPAATTGVADLFASYAALAHARDRPLRVDELNTVSCGAVPRVSRSFASALWAVDAMFELVRAGVDGVNVHTFPGAGYELFGLTQHASGWSATVASEYYGLLLFAHATPPGARLLTTSAEPAADPGLKLWATRSPDGWVRVVLIDKDPLRGHVVGLRIPGASGIAELQRLTAPRLRAQHGTTLGGQSVDPATGALGGPAVVQHVSAYRGRYVVQLPAASAALLTVRAS